MLEFRFIWKVLNRESNLLKGEMKVQSTGLAERYLEDNEFALNLRMIPALAFIPPQDVIQAFEILSEHLRETYGNEIDQLIDYFEDNYIGRFRRARRRVIPTFQKESWNMFHRTEQEMPRTNNNKEG